MRGAGDELSVGERVAFFRRRRGLTQTTLADLVGRSERWVSMIENGERPLSRFDVIRALADALRVTMEDLLGQPVLAEADHSAGDNIPAVRDALMNHRRLSTTLFGSQSSVDPDVESVAQYASHAWLNYQHGRLGGVIEALPGLIRSAQTLEERSSTDQMSNALIVSSRIHHLAATTLSKLGEGDLAWIAAERAMTAGERSGDALALASASRAGTHALLASGRFADAVDLGERAAAWLLPQVRNDDPAALSVLGMLHLRTAIAAAHRQDRSATRNLLTSADDLAARLGRDDNLWNTSFGPTNVKLHQVAASLNLDDIAWVLEHGDRVDTARLPAERTVAHKIDLARANSYRAKDDVAIAYLLDAEGIAPQLVRQSAAVRETVKALYRRGTGLTKHSPLIGLAERCRAI